MTALSRYEKLECTAQYFASRDAISQDVVLALGNTTLILSKMDGVPLAHWDLSSLVTVEDTETGSWICPDYLADEFIFVPDADMVQALSTLQAADGNGPPTPLWRRRLKFVLTTTAIVAVGAVVFLGVKDRAADFLPSKTLAKMQSAWVDQNKAELCNTPEAQTGLDIAQASLGVPVYVRPNAAKRVTGLPNGGLAISNDLLKQADNAAALVGFLALIQTQEQQTHAVTTAINQLPITELATLFITKDIGADHIKNIAMPSLRIGSLSPSDALVSLENKRLSAKPVGAFLTTLGNDQLGQAITTAAPQNETSADLMADGAWLAFQNICEG